MVLSSVRGGDDEKREASMVAPAFGPGLNHDQRWVGLRFGNAHDVGSGRAETVHIVLQTKRNVRRHEQFRRRGLGRFRCTALRTFPFSNVKWNYCVRQFDNLKLVFFRLWAKLEG